MGCLFVCLFFVSGEPVCTPPLHGLTSSPPWRAGGPQEKRIETEYTEHTAHRATATWAVWEQLWAAAQGRRERLHRGMHRIQADAEGQALGRKTAGRSAQAPRGVRTHGKAAVSSSGRQRVYSKPPFLKEMPALLKRPALPAHTSSSLISTGLK